MKLNSCIQEDTQRWFSNDKKWSSHFVEGLTVFKYCMELVYLVWFRHTVKYIFNYVRVDQPYFWFNTKRKFEFHGVKHQYLMMRQCAMILLMDFGNFSLLKLCRYSSSSFNYFARGYFVRWYLFVHLTLWVQ